MRILLVLPAAAHVRVTKKTDVPDRAMLRFSVLPLLTVAALTPPEHEVIICDENVEPLDLKVDVDLVGISFMTAIANRAYEIAAHFRKRDIVVVGGGYHATLYPGEAAQHFDSLVIGDAEDAWPKLLGDVERGALLPQYRSTAPVSLAGLPEPRRDLLQKTSRHYATVNAVQASRGCRHSCSYCSIAAFHKCGYRHRPVADVIAELQRLSRRFIFVDDNLIADPDYARELFEALIPLRKLWVGQCSLKIADDPELLALAYRAGCRALFLGIETLSEENLKAVGKSCNSSAEYIERIKKIKRAGIGIVAGIIVGMDDDDAAVFQRTLKFLSAAEIDCVQVNIMTPLPGTPLFETMKQTGRIRDFDWDHYDFRHCVIEPKRMSAQELQDGADWLYRQFYRLDRILLRTVRTLFRSGPSTAIVGLKLGLTYRYDNIRENIVGRNPAQSKSGTVPIIPIFTNVRFRRGYGY